MTWSNELFSGVWIFVRKGQKELSCEICSSPLLGVLEWGLVHGRATCRRCGAAYQCLRHKDGKLQDLPPLCLVNKKALSGYKNAWKASRDKREFDDKCIKLNGELGI